MIKISIVQQASDLCLDIVNVLKFIMGSNAGFADVLSVLILGKIYEDKTYYYLLFSL
jgi:hypothetical protein